MALSSHGSSDTAGESLPVSRSTRSDLVATLWVGAVAAVFVVIMLVLRLVEIFGGGSMAVPVQFAPVETLVPGDGRSASVTIDSGVVQVSDLPVTTFVSVVLADVLPALAALIVIGCAVVVFRRLWHGQAFLPGTARLVTISGFTILGGWIASIVFGTMASNGALAVAAGGEFSGVAMHIDWLPFLAAMALGGLAILIRSGERLRADTAGLV